VKPKKHRPPTTSPEPDPTEGPGNGGNPHDPPGGIIPPLGFRPFA